MEKIWNELYMAAKKVQSPRSISKYMEAGGVAAAIESASGKIYVGVCVDTACSIGVCAERNAMFNMITNGEDKIKRVIAVMSDGRTAAPCGVCREFMAQLMGEDYKNVEVMVDYEKEIVMTLGDLIVQNWF